MTGRNGSFRALEGFLSPCGAVFANWGKNVSRRLLRMYKQALKNRDFEAKGSRRRKTGKNYTLLSIWLKDGAGWGGGLTRGSRDPWAHKSRVLRVCRAWAVDTPEDTDVGAVALVLASHAYFATLGVRRRV